MLKLPTGMEAVALTALVSEWAEYVKRESSIEVEVVVVG